MSAKLQMLTGASDGPIVENREFLDLNDALFQNEAHMQMGELDEEVQMLRMKTARVKADNIQTMLAGNDALA